MELEEQQRQQREKVPRRIIHFSSGETMEEYSTDEEEEEEVKVAERKDLLSSPAEAVRVSMGEDVAGTVGGERMPIKCVQMCVAVQADLGSLRMVPHVEGGHVHHLRLVTPDARAVPLTREPFESRSVSPDNISSKNTNMSLRTSRRIKTGVDRDVWGSCAHSFQL